MRRAHKLARVARRVVAEPAVQLVHGGRHARARRRHQERHEKREIHVLHALQHAHDAPPVARLADEERRVQVRRVDAVLPVEDGRRPRNHEPRPGQPLGVGPLQVLLKALRRAPGVLPRHRGGREARGGRLGEAPRRWGAGDGGVACVVVMGDVETAVRRAGPAVAAALPGKVL